MAGNGNGGNGHSHSGRHLSLIEARMPVGTVTIIGDDAKPRTVTVWPLSTGAQEDLLVLRDNASAKRLDGREALRVLHRIAKDCIPDASDDEIRRLDEYQTGDLIAFAQTTGNEVEATIAERRAKANPPTAAARTPPGKGSRRATGRGTSP